MYEDDPIIDETELSKRAAAEREWHTERAEMERHQIAESKRMFDEAEAYSAKQREASKRKSAADRSFAEAAEFATNQIKSDGLNGEIRPYGEVRYTVAQGLKAAVHSREDGVAALVLQRDILVRLDSIKFLLWLVIALLAFVTLKLI